MRVRRLPAVFVLMLAVACTGSAIPTTTTTTTSLPDTTTTTAGGRVSLIPNSTPFIREGDRGPYVFALQFYLVCTGHEEPSPGGAKVSVDGAFGPITADAVAYYQAELRRIPSGDPDEDTFASLARDCAQERTLTFPEGEVTTEIAGNVDAGDAEVYSFAGAGGQVLSLDAAEGIVSISVVAADGSAVQIATEGTRVEAELDLPQEYSITIEAASPTSYRLTASLRSPNVVVSDFGPMVLEGDGIGIADFGQDPVNTVAVIALLFGTPFSDSGWLTDETGCTGTNRHVSWIIQGDSNGSQHPAIFTADFTDTGGLPYFSQYSYRTFDLAALDPLARGLTTSDSLSIGSTLAAFLEVYDDVSFTNPSLGLTEESDITFQFQLVGGASDPDEEASRITYIGAGADGCPDFG